MIRYITFLALLTGALWAESWQNFDKNNSGLADNEVKCLAISPDSLKWFGTDSGLSVYDGMSWKTFTTADGLPDNCINDIVVERSGSGYFLWLATTAGVITITPVVSDTLHVIDAYNRGNSALVSDSVRAIALDTNQVKWFGTDRGVSVLANNGWTTADEDNFLISNLTLDTESNSQGLVHIASRGGGVSRLRYDEVDAVTAASTIVATWSWMLSDTIYCVFIDQNDVQWYGTGEGLFRHTGIDSKRNWTVYQTNEGLVDNRVRAITQDTSGTVWVGTLAGVSSLSNDDFVNFTTQDGLVDDRVNDIAVDFDGSVWFATSGGISQYSAQPSRIETINHLPQNIKIANYPNPFNAGTVFYLTLPTPDYVELQLYNILGERVRAFARRLLPSGRHHIYWDGKDDQGSSLPSGVYLARIASGTTFYSHKVMILK